MQLAADTHVHIYPFYKVETALQSVIKNLGPKSPGRIKVACLTERYDCDLFNSLSGGSHETRGSGITDQFEISPDDGSLLIRRRSDDDSFYMLPGQQIITAENIEILSLNCSARVAEQRNAVDTVKQVLDAGGVPVAAWAPGKWFFQRGRVIAGLLEHFSPSELALGDTTLRPIGWTMPNIIRQALKGNFKLLFGSDPLPFSGEEVRPGSYFSNIDVPNGGADSVMNPEKVIARLLQDDIKISAAGHRGSLPDVLTRLYRNSRAPKPERV